MSWEQIQTTLVGLAVSAIVGIIGKWFGVKVTTEQRSQAQWAIEQGVAYAALKLKNAQGLAKKAEALSVAQSLAPKALSKLDDEQKSILIDSTYAKMKASLPHKSTYSVQGQERSDVVPLPPPSKVPKLS
jgi:hypothetical protein